MDCIEPSPNPTPSVTSVTESSKPSLSPDRIDIVSPKSSASDWEIIAIPSKWWDDTMKSINDKKLTPNTRKEIVQTLVTLLISKFGSNLQKSRVEAVARLLILKYPFMRDDIGTGYVSCIGG